MDLRAVRHALADEDVRSISRRYFVSNGFDGTLTSVGIAMGSFLSGVSDGRTVVAVGVGAAIGLCTSGVWSVWEIERAETLADLRRVERAMLTDLGGTLAAETRTAGRTINALASGTGPLVGILVPLTPYLFVGPLSLTAATALAVALGVAVLFVFGAYMGAVAGLRWHTAGVRMGLAGLVVAAVNWLLSG